MDYQKAWTILSSILNNPVYLNDYSIDPARVMDSLGVTDAEEQAAFNNVLVPVAEFRQVLVNTFKQSRDYEKKITALTELVQNPEAAALFQASPAQVLTNYGIILPQEQQQLMTLLQSVKQFQQLAFEKYAETMDYNRKMECLKNMLQPNQQTAIYTVDPATYFANFGIKNPQDQEMLSDMLRPARELQNMVLENAANEMAAGKDVIESYQESIAKTNRETINGFRSTMLMYQVSFYAGIALMVAAVVFAVVLRSSLFSIVFGSIGTLELLTFFIANPPMRLQESRSEHTKLNAAFYSWYVDLYNWNVFYSQYGKERVPFEIIKQVSDAQIGNTRKLMDIITTTQMNAANANK